MSRGHRDLKPDNIMIVADAQAPGGERTKVLDFGIAKITEEVGTPQPLTNSNAVIGTCYYMSPEQCRGAGKVDNRTDVYSLGVILYEMLSGQRPITGEGTGEIISRHLTQEPVPLVSRAPQVPVAVTTLVHRMLLKDREQRPTMQTVGTELEALTEQFPLSVRRRNTANTPIIPSMRSMPGEETVRSVPSQPTSVSAPHSLAGTAAFQARLFVRRGRNLGVAGALLAVLLLLVVWAIRGHNPPAEAGLSGPKTIHLRIDSQPSGAAVVQVTDGQVLGKTPWVLERPAAKGTFKIRLYLPDYAGKEVALDVSTDSTLTEVLVPLPGSRAEAASQAGAAAQGTDQGQGADAANSGADGSKKKHHRHKSKSFWPFK